MNPPSLPSLEEKQAPSLEHRSRSIECALVTGATGFLGRHLVQFLKKLGVLTVGLARQDSETPTRTYAADVRNREAVNLVFEKTHPQLVFHLAGSRRRDGSFDSLEELVAVNILGTANILEAAARTGTMRVVISGTAEEYGRIEPPFRESDRENPCNLYGATNLAASRLAITFGELTGLPTTVVRTTIAYGPGQGKDMFVPALMEALARGERFSMTQGRQRKDFVYASDVAEGMVRAALEPRAEGRILNLGSGVPTPVIEVAELAQKLAGKEGLLGVGELPTRDGEILEYFVDMSTTIEVLGWSPRVSLEDGLRKTFESIKRQQIS